MLNKYYTPHIMILFSICNSVMIKKKIIFILWTACSGKTTNFNYILSTYSEYLTYVPSYTTRSMRVGEVNGIRYHHISREKFNDMIANNEWLEYFNAPGVHRGHYYGTKKSDIDDVHRQGKIPIKEIQIDGLQQVIDNYTNQYDIISLFLTISDEEIRRRMNARGVVAHEEMLEERILHTQRERDFAQEHCTCFIDSTPALDIVQMHIKVFMDEILN